MKPRPAVSEFKCKRCGNTIHPGNLIRFMPELAAWVHYDGGAGDREVVSSPPPSLPSLAMTDRDD